MILRYAGAFFTVLNPMFYTDISDIPDETLLYFLSNIDTYIGGETPLQERRNEIVENFFEMPNLGLRVL